MEHVRPGHGLGEIARLLGCLILLDVYGQRHAGLVVAERGGDNSAAVVQRRPRVITLDVVVKLGPTLSSATLPRREKEAKGNKARQRDSLGRVLGAVHCRHQCLAYVIRRRGLQ